MTKGASTGQRSLRRNAHGRVVHEIGERIVRGTLTNHNLPNETDLGIELGVSRTIVREAIKTLSAKGMIISRPKTGMQIRDRKEWNILDPDVLGWISSVGNFEEFAESLFEMRQIIEPAAAAIAARRATPEAISRIKAAYEEMEAADEDVEAGVEPDVRFHQAILAATDNVFLAPLGALIESALATIFQLSRSNPGAIRNSLPQHKAVMDAIVTGDADAASDMLRKLLADAAMDYSTVVANQIVDQTHEKGAQASGLKRLKSARKS